MLSKARPRRPSACGRLGADPGLFFQPVQVHLQPPDLGIEPVRAGGRVGGPDPALDLEQARRLFPQLPLPLAPLASDAPRTPGQFR
jgi:hypothetical protein